MESYVAISADSAGVLAVSTYVVPGRGLSLVGLGVVSVAKQASRSS